MEVGKAFIPYLLSTPYTQTSISKHEDHGTDRENQNSRDRTNDRASDWTVHQQRVRTFRGLAGDTQVRHLRLIGRLAICPDLLDAPQRYQPCDRGGDLQSRGWFVVPCLGNSHGLTVPHHLASEKDIDLAVKAARLAFKTTWGKNVTGFERSRLLNKLADLIERDQQERPYYLARRTSRSLILFTR